MNESMSPVDILLLCRLLTSLLVKLPRHLSYNLTHALESLDIVLTLFIVGFKVLDVLSYCVVCAEIA